MSRVPSNSALSEARFDNMMARVEYGGCKDCEVGEPHPHPERRFPVLGTRLMIPWSVAEMAYAAYAEKFPGAARIQDCERIAQRGGFAPEELDDLLRSTLPNWLDSARERRGHRAV